ncbi:MAG: chorismate-binding protein [Odoribacteraceae bacterium]|jgi:isochorismate synthase|nr:chorismate-binding protein [Odoribacteraceae bacterium]
MTSSRENTLSVAAAQALCLENGIPFYTYRLPGSGEVVFGAQLSGELNLFQGFERRPPGKGFVVTPFNPASWSFPYFIRADVSFTGELSDAGAIAALRGATYAVPPPREPGEREPNHREYVDEARRLLAVIEREGLRKVVLARTITVPRDALALAPLLFERMMTYGEAFLFMFSLPGKGTWTGASPELFLKYDRDGFRAMALAATRPVDGTPFPVAWSAKEREEQQIVSDYILETLSPFFTRHLERGEPATTRAANLYHLCTRFYSDEQLPADEIDRLVAQLHPTPAVCGLPKKRAMQLIAETEWQERGYYGGLVGPVGQNGAFDLFVNIRSMELFPGAFRLHVGGGITPLSDPGEEWRETCQKADTLLNLVREIDHDGALV